MNRYTLAIFLTLLAAPVRAGQTKNVPVIQLPALTIAGTTLQTTVSYDSARQVYRYAYVIVAPVSNQASIGGFNIDVSGATSHQQIDPDLQNNVVRRDVTIQQLQPNTTIPVGMSVPDPNAWYAGLSVKGQWAVFPNDDTSPLRPGTQQGGFVLESKFPPALRDARISPDTDAWDAIEEQYGESVTYQPLTADQYDVHLKVPAPSEPTDASLYSGGGQQPAEVNKLLRYAAPTDNRMKLPAGTASQYVIVYYGASAIPATFHATLNGADISSQFHPVPGTAQVVTIPLVGGSNKLQLSIDGKKTSGQTATDADTFTFIVG